MGPNGSGKTTLLRSIAGIPEIPSQISKGKDVRQSYVGHANALKTYLTVEQNLLSQTNATPDELKQALIKFNILKFAHQHVQTLSAGQRRQIALARLPLSRAQLWIVDEPTTHLDERATALFWEIMRDHQHSGGAAIISSHASVPISKIRVVTLHG